MTTSHSIDWLQGIDGLDQLRADWDRLAAECAPRSVFHRHAWARAWLAAYGEVALNILVLRSASRAVAILPWVRLPGRFLGLPVRRYVLLGGVPTETTRQSGTARWLCRDLRWGWGATTPLLVTRDDRERVLAAALDATVHALRPDLLQAQGLEPELTFTAAWPRAVITSTEPNWIAPSGGADTGRQRLAKPTKKRIAKRTKKHLASGLAALQALPGYSFEVAPGATLVEADLEELAQLEAKSTKALAGASILTSGPRNRAFLWSLLQHEKSCRVGRMRSGGNLIAWAMGLRCADRGEGLVVAHDPAYDEQYPGLLGYLMLEESLDGEAPLASWSFGRGAEFWKTERLQAQPEARTDVAFYAPTWRGRLLRLVHARVAALASRRRAAREATQGPTAPTLSAATEEE